MSKVSAKQVLKYHWKKAMLFPKDVATSFVVAPITILLERYVAPLIIAALLAAIQAGTVTIESSVFMIIGYAALQIASQVIGYRINLFAMWSVQIKGVRKIYNESYVHLTEQSLDFYANNFAGSLVSKANKFADAFSNFWASVVFRGLFILTSLVGTLVGVAFLMWQYSLVLLVLVILFTVASYYGTRFMRPRQKAFSEARTHIAAQLSDSISNMFAVKIDSGERREHKRLSSNVEAMIEKELKVRSGIMGISVAYSSIIMMMRVAALVVSIIMVQQGIAGAAVVYLLITFTFSLIQEIWNISDMLRDYYQIVGNSEEMLEILNTPASIKDKTSKKMKVTKGAVALKDIGFTHADETVPLFSNFSIKIAAGQKVGIVGVSGSGKTTLTKLLMRFVEPQDGRIEIDGQDIAKVTQASLHDAIAYVPQEPLLFHRSIKENIAYSRPGASDEEIRSAAKQANALDFIEKLPNGFDTLVGERGVKLSGGQRQRVAIARAILKSAPILILDEATSALDSESEKLIQEALGKLMQGRTSVVIAHRLSTIAQLDRIIVLDNGNIVEDGPHSELLKKNGLYARLWKHQSGGFIEE